MIKNKVIYKYLKILVVCIFVLLVAVQAGKSFVLDELDFPIVSQATNQTLKPIYYRGEASPKHVGTYHPTLYINSLAFFIHAFGYNEASVRFFGVLCTLATATVLLLILRQLTKKSDFAEVLFLGLFLLNPYTIQNTTLPDIDSTVLPVVLLLFIYFAIRFLHQERDTSNRAILILGALFGLTLWSKLTTPLVIPLFLFCLAAITSNASKNTQKYKESLLFALKVSLVGTIGFVTSYFIYCKLLGLNTTYTYHFLIDSFTKGTSHQGPLVGAINNLKNVRYFVYWVTLPLLGLLGVSSLGALLDRENDEKTKIKKLLVVLALMVTVFYIALISPFGGFFKYPFPVFGILILMVAAFYERYFRNFSILWIYPLLALIFGYELEKNLWKDYMFKHSSALGFILAFSILVAVVVYYFCLKLRPKNVVAAYLFVLFSCFGIGFQLSISRVQAIATYSTKYLYGQTGMSDAAAYLRSNTKSDEVIWSMKDIGYYTNNKYEESYGYYFDPALQSKLVAMLKDGKIRYYVVTSGIGQDNIDYYTNIKQILNDNAVKEKQFGNFVIYKAKAAN